MNRSIKFKVGLFVLLSLVVVIASMLFVARKKDVFASMTTYKLSSVTGDNLTAGMPVVFSGFQIGKVTEVDLEDNGLVVITVQVPSRHNKRIRSNSTWTLEKPFIGLPRIVLATPDPNAPLADSKVVVKISSIDDINEIIKKAQPLLEKVGTIAANMEKLTGPDGDLEATLANTKKLSAAFAQKDSILEMATGDKKNVAALGKTIQKIPELMANVDKIVKHVDELMGKTDEQVLGRDGALQSVRAILKDFEAKLKKLDSTLDNLGKISGDVAGSSKDLPVLRKEIDETVNSANDLIKDIRKLLPEEKRDIKVP